MTRKVEDRGEQKLNAVSECSIPRGTLKGSLASLSSAKEVGNLVVARLSWTFHFRLSLS